MSICVVFHVEFDFDVRLAVAPQKSTFLLIFFFLPLPLPLGIEGAEMHLRNLSSGASFFPTRPERLYNTDFSLFYVRCARGDLLTPVARRSHPPPLEGGSVHIETYSRLFLQYLFYVIYSQSLVFCNSRSAVILVCFGLFCLN